MINSLSLLNSVNIRKVTHHHKKELNAPTTLEEVKYAVINLKGNTSPGPDSLTVEFYKKFERIYQDIYLNYFGHDRKKEKIQTLWYRRE